MGKINQLATVSVLTLMVSACAMSLPSENSGTSNCCSKSISQDNINVRHQQSYALVTSATEKHVEDLAFELEKARDAAVNDGRRSIMNYYRNVYRAAVLSAYKDGYLPSPVPEASEKKRYQQQYDKDAQIIIHQPAAKTLYFEYDSVGYADSEAAQDILQKHRDFLLKTKGRVLVVGYADISGSAGYNLALGRKRAERVKSELVAQGIPSELVSVVSFGSTYSQPLLLGHADNLKLWRKVELYY
ncbi:OmpA family protein [Shewanella oncorhynchi]|uniref:OmpA family protein n=1 Tax=Shewanella TaxID=22 RepID=UPI0039AFC676